MDTKLATTQVRTEQWTRIIHDRKESGLTIDAYCEEHGLSRNAYYYWLRRVKETALKSSGIEFAELTAPMLSDSDRSSSVISIDINGMTIHLESQISKDYLSDILEAAAHVK